MLHNTFGGNKQHYDNIPYNNANFQTNFEGDKITF